MNDSNYVSFIKSIDANGIIPLCLYKTSVISKVTKIGYDYDELFSMVSQMKSFYIKSFQRADNSIGFNLYTSYGVFKLSEHNNRPELVITDFRETNFKDTNDALMKGVKINANEGIRIKFIIRDYNRYDAFQDGRLRNLDECSETDGVYAIDCIKKVCIDGEEIETEKKEENSEELTQLLEIAETYSILSNDLEKKKANEVGRISYLKYEPIEYARQDRVAYKFIIDKQEEDIFNVGINVDLIGTDNDSIYTAEVIEVGKQGSNDYLVLLFNDELDLSVIPKNGWIRLSVSPVNMYVQTNAIDKLKKGNAEAKYFDDVLGHCTTKGIDEGDLSDLEKSIKEQDPPPNASQLEAIKNGINTQDVYLVMGPPGTGKTTVILEWVKYFVKTKKWRVLVSSQNNKAVDNVLERLSEEKDMDTLRIGSEAKIQDGVIPFLFENKIKKLRNKIYKSTSEAIENVNDTINNWSRFIEILEKHTNELINLNELKDKSDQFVDSNIKPARAELNQLKKDNNKLLEKINKEKDNYLEAEEYIRRNGDKKVFPHIITNIKIRKSEKIKIKSSQKIDYLIQEQNDIANQYNKKRKELEKHYSYFDKELLEPYYSEYNSLISSKEMLSKEKKQGNEELNLFCVEPLDESDYYDIDKVQSYYNILLSEKERANNISETIDEWQKQISGKQNYAIQQIILDSVDLVGATCIGVNSQKRFQDLDFDVTIIDEAGQIQLHNAFVPMSVSNKLIMLGDYMQIPPNADSDMVKLCEENDIETEYLGKSLFEKMFNDLPESNKTLLDTQYRMPAEIADVISEWFYDGEYKSPDFKRNGKAEISTISSKNFILIDTSHRKNNKEKEDPKGGYNNSLEAKIIEGLVDHIIHNTEFKEKQMGIISAYKSQVRLIQSKLRRMVNNPDNVKELVASLDSFQGQERDIIIYSFTRSSYKKANENRIGFLKELRRLNVAMSRCKKTLIMIGNFDYLSKCKKNYAEQIIMSKDKTRIVNGSEAVFSDFIKFMCKQVKEGKGEIIEAAELINRIKEQ